MGLARLRVLPMFLKATGDGDREKSLVQAFINLVTGKKDG